MRWYSPRIQIGVDNRDYHYLSHSEIDGGKRISQHLSGPARSGTLTGQVKVTGEEMQMRHRGNSAAHWAIRSTLAAVVTQRCADGTGGVAFNYPVGGPDLDGLPRPEEFSLGSPESRAAAHAMLDRRNRGIADHRGRAVPRWAHEKFLQIRG